MNAAPIPTSPGPWRPDPMRQQRADYAVEDLLTLPDGHNTSRQPDVLLYRAGLPSDRSRLRPADVILAVEIVSPGTRRVDRFAKPGEYAAAGIPFYWRVEQNPVHLYAYRLGDRIGPGGERQYELETDSAELIELAEPFDIKLPITEIIP